jgi:hypothetical protein
VPQVWLYKYKDPHVSRVLIDPIEVKRDGDSCRLIDEKVHLWTLSEAQKKGLLCLSTTRPQEQRPRLVSLTAALVGASSL